MLLNAHMPDIKVVLNFSKIDKATVQADFKPAVLGTHYSLNAEETEMTKLGGGASSGRCFEVTGRPRTGEKCYMRFKRNGGPGSYYITLLISDTLVNANNQLAWSGEQYAPNVWHEVKIEHVSGSTYRYLINGNVLYTGTATHLSFYCHTDITKIEVDCGQQGAALPSGYVWL